MAEFASELPEADGKEGTSEAVARLLLTRRMEDFRAGARLALLPSLGSMVALIYMFSDRVPLAVLLGWAGALVSAIVVQIIADYRFTCADATLADLRGHWRRLMALEWLSSAIWAAMIPYLATAAEGLTAAVLAVIAITLLSGVLLVYRTAPSAARVHIALLTASIAVATMIQAGSGGWPALLLLAVFVLALVCSVQAQNGQIIAAARAEISRREAAGTVRMLLYDYEEHSSDWLWTVDPAGKLRDVSRRFAEAAGKAVHELEGMALLDMFAPGEDRDRLERHLLEHSRFRDFVIKVRVDDGVRYWKLSARPRSDGRMSGVARDVTGDRLSEDRVAFMAHYDNLTGLANRYLFNERLRSALSQDDQPQNVVLFYLDLDNFKAVNDTRGHLVGDRLLREVGAKIALDDFGVGYSSLSYLRRFPFDRIKIDKDFVKGIETCSDNKAIVSSITRLAEALGMAATAEGVETRGQLDLLRELGCQEAQGYLICEPVPGENFATADAVEAAMKADASGILDYRKAREAALKRRSAGTG